MKDYCELVVIEHNRVGFVDGSANIQTEYPHKWDKDTLTYAVIQGSNDAWIFSKLRKAVGLAFSTWGTEIPTKFKCVSKEKNPDITIQFVNQKGVDIYLDEHPRTLAYAWYPQTSKEGNIIFNDYRYHWGLRDGRTISDDKVYNVIHVLIHEIGHSLGLRHAEIKNGIDIMDPKYNGKVTLSYYDIFRIRKKYGIRMFSRWNVYSTLKRILNIRKGL